MEKRFRALRTIATVYKILGCLILIFGVLISLLLFASGLLGGAAATPRDLSGALGGGIAGMFLAVGVLLYALALFLILYGAGEAIYLGIAIEENTRETSQLLRHSRS
ncbi:MAG: hypothetical protein M3447_01360 [Acidobacteriota bacterium]|nr:hypothetical protein [Acidobacteriota bacterium]